MGRVIRRGIRLVRRGFRFVDRMTGGLLGKGLKLVGKVAKVALPIVGLAAPFLLPGVGGAITGLLSKFGGAGGLFGSLATKATSLFSTIGTKLAPLGTRLTGMFQGAFGKGGAIRSMFGNGLSTMRGWGSQLASGFSSGQSGQYAANPYGNPSPAMSLLNMGAAAMPMMMMFGGPRMSMY